MAHSYPPQAESRVSQYPKTQSDAYPYYFPGSVDQPQRAQLSFFSRLGSWGIFVILGSIPLTLGALAFIIFLWSSNSDNDIWRKIVLAGWAPRSITLASLVIRWSVATQSGIAASMLAAVALHGSQVLLQDSAAVSMLRYLNTGPHSLAIPLTKTARTAKGFGLWMMVILLSATTVLVQFTSTVLLSDLHQAPTNSDLQISTFRYELNTSYDDNIDVSSLGYSYWTTKPPFYPTFAEYKEDVYEPDYAYDTGVTLRGLLPIASQAVRASLSSYSGPATILDNRVICVRPALDHILISLSILDYKDRPEYLTVFGTVAVDEGLGVNPYYENFNRRAAINCTAPLMGELFKNDDSYSVASLREWRLSYCLVVGIDPDKVTTTINSEQDLWDTFLVMNTTGNLNSWQHAINSGTIFTQTHLEENNEWARFGNSEYGVELGLSVCTLNTIPVDVHIHASGGRNHTEAEIGWDSTVKGYNTSALRASLGVEEENSAQPSDRGHLQMPKPDQLGLNKISNDWDVFDTALNMGSIEANQSIFVCTHCYHDILNEPPVIKEVHPALAALFNDAVRFTNHPALGFQALYNTMASMAYYDTLQLFDIEAAGSFVTFVEALAPTTWTGLKAVLAVLAVHLVLVAVIFIMFARMAKETLVGNVWSVLSQVSQSAEIQPWLVQSSMAKDTEVRKWIRAQGDDKTLVGVGYDVEKNRMELRRR